MRTGGTHIQNSDITPGGRTRGGGGGSQRVQNPFGTNIVMLHIKSGNEEQNTVVQKFAPEACLGVIRGQKVGFGSFFFFFFFFIVTQLLLGFLS